MLGTRILRRRVARRSGLPALVLATLILPMGDAGALDPQPRTYREKQKHQFRDVQLGLTHPAPHGRSTPARTLAAGNADAGGDGMRGPAAGVPSPAGQPRRQEVSR